MPGTGCNPCQIEPTAPAKTLQSLLKVTLDYKHLFKYHRLIDEEPLEPSLRCLWLSNTLSVCSFGERAGLQCSSGHEHPKHLFLTGRSGPVLHRAGWFTTGGEDLGTQVVNRHQVTTHSRTPPNTWQRDGAVLETSVSQKGSVSCWRLSTQPQSSDSW